VPPGADGYVDGGGDAPLPPAAAAAAAASASRLGGLPRRVTRRPPALLAASPDPDPASSRRVPSECLPFLAFPFFPAPPLDFPSPPPLSPPSPLLPPAPAAPAPTVVHRARPAEFETRRHPAAASLPPSRAADADINLVFVGREMFVGWHKRPLGDSADDAARAAPLPTSGRARSIIVCAEVCHGPETPVAARWRASL